MTTGPDDSNRLDPTVIAMAALVSIHCLAARWLPPVLGGDGAHLILALLLGGLSATVIFGGWMKHRDGRVWFWAGAGWIGLFIARVGRGNGLNEGAEAAATFLACGLLFLAHLLNRSLSYWHSKT